MEIDISIDEKTYWKIHEELSKEFKPYFPNLNQLGRGIFVFNTFNQVLAKNGIILGKKEEYQ